MNTETGEGEARPSSKKKGTFIYLWNRKGINFPPLFVLSLSCQVVSGLLFSGGFFLSFPLRTRERAAKGEEGKKEPKTRKFFFATNRRCQRFLSFSPNLSTHVVKSKRKNCGGSWKEHLFLSSSFFTFSFSFSSPTALFLAFIFAKRLCVCFGGRRRRSRKYAKEGGRGKRKEFWLGSVVWVSTFDKRNSEIKYQYLFESTLTSILLEKISSIAG